MKVREPCLNNIAVLKNFEWFFQKVGLLIKLVREYKLQKSFKTEFFMPALKPPKKIKFS